jgi:hypothetical protein
VTLSPLTPSPTVNALPTAWAESSTRPPSIDRLAQGVRVAPGTDSASTAAFQPTGGWLGFRGRGGEALQVKLGRGADGRTQVQTAGGKTYAVPPSVKGREAIAQWLHQADAAGAVTGAWPNPKAAPQGDAFKVNRAQITARERLSGTWDVKVTGVKAGMTYGKASLEYDKKNGTLKMYVQPPAGELQLFEIDCGATIHNQRGALTSNGVAGVTHDLFRLQKEHPVLSMVAWTVMGAIGAVAIKNPEVVRHFGIGAASFAIAGQADEVRVSLAQTKVSGVAQTRLNVIELTPGGGSKPLTGEARAGLTAEGSLLRTSAVFNTPGLGPSSGIPFGERARAIEYRGGAFVGKVELHGKVSTENGLHTIKPDVKAQEFVSLGGKKESGWREVIGEDGRALDLSTSEGRKAATGQFAGIPTKLRLQALDPDDKGKRYSLVTGVVPRLEVNAGRAGQRIDPTIYQSRSPIDNAISQLVFGRDSAYGGTDVTEGWQKNWNEFNRVIGAPFSNRLVPLKVIAGDLKAIGNKYPERYGDLAYVNEKRLLEANGERLYWVQTGRDTSGKPVRVPCLREGDTYNTSLVTVEGKSGLHLASAQQKQGSRVAQQLPAGEPTRAWPGPSPSDSARKSAGGCAAYRVAESYRQRLLTMQSNPGLSEKQRRRIDGQIETLTQRLAQARTRLVAGSNGMLRVEGDRLVASPRLTTAIATWPLDAARQDAYKQYLTTL